MATPRLIKRTVTEELFDQPASCRRSDVDDDNDAIDDDMDEAEPTSGLHGTPQGGAGVDGIEAASTDGTGLDGEEDR